MQHDLAKMDQFEEKLREELVTLKKTVCSMENDLSVFSDIDQLKSNAKKKKQVYLFYFTLSHIILYLFH